MTGRATERARILRSLDVVWIGWLFFAVLNGAQARPHTAALDVAVAGTTLVLRLLARGPRDASPVVHASLAVSVLGLAIAAAWSGTTGSIAWWYLVAAPLYAGHLGGRRAGIAWAAVVASIAGGLAVIEPHAAGWAEFVPGAAERAVGVAVLAAITLAFALVSRSVHARQVEELERRGARIEEQAAELRARVGELELAREAALEGSRTKSALLRNVGHAIGTPLHAALGSLELLGAEPLGEPARARASVARTAVQALAATLHDVATLAQIESGELALARRPVVLRALLERARAELAELAAERGVALCPIEADPGASFLGDEERLASMLGALLRNAILASETGGRVALRGELAGEALGLEVSDEGTGIDAGERARLTAAFRTRDDGYARASGGAGLGLAVASGLARAIGGSLELVAGPERGTIARVRLRVAEGSATESVPAAARSVLVVDDDPIAREVTTALTRRLGLDVAVAADAAGALESLARAAADVVLLDLHMPGVDGFELARRIRDRAIRPAPRLVALSASRYDATAHLAAAGIERLLPKPATSQALARVLGIAEHPAEPAAALPGVNGRAAPDEVDLVALEHLREAFGPDELRDLIRDLGAQSAELLATIDAALARGDLPAVASAAHTLKGSQGTVGGRVVATTAASLERAAREGRACVALAAEVREAIGRARVILERETAL